MQKQMIKTNTLRTFLHVYSLVKSEQLSANINLTPTKHPSDLYVMIAQPGRLWQTPEKQGPLNNW
jgi:hypothetical protein